MPLRILLVDDHAIVRQGIRSLLEGDLEITVVGEANDGLEAIEKASELKPDIIIMDISMPNLNGIEATRHILSNDSSLKIIMLSGSVSRKFVSESIKAGASGYISKTSMFEELCEAVKVVKEGLSYISPSITTILINDYIENASDVKQEDINALTGRERGMLQMLAEGKNAKQIAEVFGVSSKTVDAERRVIMEKLDRYSIAELTKYAISQGLTSVDF